MSDTIVNSRIMYIEQKVDGVTGPARIGRVTFSKSGKTIYYRGKTFQSCDGRGFKCNYFDTCTGEGYWISGCKKNGLDRLYPGTVAIDEDVRDEYWTEIRQEPEKMSQRLVRCAGKYGGKKG